MHSPRSSRPAFGSAGFASSRGFLCCFSFLGGLLFCSHILLLRPSVHASSSRSSVSGSWYSCCISVGASFLRPGCLRGSVYLLHSRLLLLLLLFGSPVVVTCFFRIATFPFVLRLLLLCFSSRVVILFTPLFYHRLPFVWYF